LIWGSSGGFSQGADRLLMSLAANQQPRGEKTFPTGLDRSLVRFQGRETVKHWFDRCVHLFVDGDIERWQIEENLAVFGLVAWAPDAELTHATLNVLKTECSLRDYHGLSELEVETPEWRELVGAHYLRLDLDYGTLGTIGTHPLPHIHFSPNDPPRFVLNAGRSTNVIVDFLDFIYRHFFPDRWLGWAEQVWDSEWKRRGRDPERNPFSRLVTAFEANEIGFLHQHYGELLDVIEVLGRAKDDLYDLRISEKDRRLMTFPDRL
jgi:hypothetical protein